MLQHESVFLFSGMEMSERNENDIIELTERNIRNESEWQANVHFPIEMFKCTIFEIQSSWIWNRAIISFNGPVISFYIFRIENWENLDYFIFKFEQFDSILTFSVAMFKYWIHFVFHTFRSNKCQHWYWNICQMHCFQNGPFKRLFENIIQLNSIVLIFFLSGE